MITAPTGKHYDHVILDLDGTVYLSGKPIGPVVELLNAELGLGTKITVLTNNTSVSKTTYVSRLDRLGLSLADDAVITPAEVVGAWIRSTYASETSAFVLGTAELRNELAAKHGLVHSDEDPQFVLVGFDQELTYGRLRRAAEYINFGLAYYMTNIDVTCPTPSGPIPDTGSIVRALQLTTGVEPSGHFGKPGSRMAEYVRGRLESLTSTLLIGDRVYTDIALGDEMGVDTLLVLSGDTGAEPGGPETAPTYVAETLADFLQSRAGQ